MYSVIFILKSEKNKTNLGDDKRFVESRKSGV